jgi:hypothetical protein
MGLKEVPFGLTETPLIEPSLPAPPRLVDWRKTVATGRRNWHGSHEFSRSDFTGANGGSTLGAVGGDRGFASRANTGGLGWVGVFNGLCPRSPAELKDRMKEPRFVPMQKRRSQTEGRISILQRGFLGRPMRARDLPGGSWRWPGEY